MKYLIGLFLLLGCVHEPKQKPDVVPGPTPIPIPSGKLKSLFPKQEWTDLALAYVNYAGLDVLRPADGKSFCANGMSAHNWVHLLASMAKYESGFDPNQVYRESFGVNSIGLLQLSVSDNAYGSGCAFRTESDVKDPAKNLKCAVTILKKWVMRDGVIQNSANKGGARYWSVLRNSGKLASVKSTLRGWCE